MELIKADFRITQEHGLFFRQDGIEKMAMYHPAALLRDPGKKPETFEISSAYRPKFVRSASGQSWIFNDAPGHTTFIIILWEEHHYV